MEESHFAFTDTWRWAEFPMYKGGRAMKTILGHIDLASWVDPRPIATPKSCRNPLEIDPVADPVLLCPLYGCEILVSVRNQSSCHAWTSHTAKAPLHCCSPVPCVKNRLRISLGSTIATAVTQRVHKVHKKWTFGMVWSSQRYVQNRGGFGCAFRLKVQHPDNVLQPYLTEAATETSDLSDSIQPL